jgi:hypothetical protein
LFLFANCRFCAEPLDYRTKMQETTLSVRPIMKYLCLIYDEESLWQKMSPDEMGKVMGEYNAFGEDIKASGHFIGGNALQPTSSATTIRVRNGKTITSDGPFAETKEQLGGYYLIEAKDLNDALQVASRIPGAKLGSVEVRPIMVFNS